MPFIGLDLFQPPAKKNPATTAQIVLENVTIHTDAANLAQVCPLIGHNSPKMRLIFPAWVPAVKR